MHCEVAPKLLSPLNTGGILLVMTSSSSSDAENDSGLLSLSGEKVLVNFITEM